jgi:ABC-type xylose transport system substrate-binding protein
MGMDKVGTLRWLPATAQARMENLLSGFYTDKRVDAVMNGKEPEVNDTKTYNNEVKVVPSYLLTPVAVDKTNWEKILVDGGYYTKDQITQ